MIDSIIDFFAIAGESPELLIPIIGAAIGIILLIFGFKSFKIKRLIENIPTSKIRAIAMGLVEIVGKVVPIETNILSSPFSNTECVYYEYTVERWTKSDDKQSWQIVNSGKTSLPFIIKDDTGSVIVNPVGANVDLKAATYSSGTGEDPPPIVQNFLEINNLKYEGFFGANYKMRYRESIIVPNQNLFIIGRATDNPFMTEGTAQLSSEDIMIHRGKSEIYHISEKSEHKVIQSYKIKAFSGLIAGSIIIIICFNVFLLMFENI